MAKSVKQLIEERANVSSSVEDQVAMRIARWQQAVSNLWFRITAWLPVSDKSGKPLYTISEITRSEERSGSYPVESLEIRIGRSTVELVPVGTWIIGAQGRVDMRGPKATVRLIWVNEGSWLVVGDPMAPHESTPLTEESFTNALEQVLG